MKNNMASEIVKSSRRSSLAPRQRDFELAKTIDFVEHEGRGAGCTRNYLITEKYIIHNMKKTNHVYPVYLV
ncbi:MAG: hypothetical protein KAS17_11105 [Victivallaceae bacterium]|nr:hypothetical protein [Victivallaceae bacterium]